MGFTGVSSSEMQFSLFSNIHRPRFPPAHVVAELKQKVAQLLSPLFPFSLSRSHTSQQHVCNGAIIFSPAGFWCRKTLLNLLTLIPMVNKCATKTCVSTIKRTILLIFTNLFSLLLELFLYGEGSSLVLWLQ